MKNEKRKPPTPLYSASEVARLLNGEITDPSRAKAIFDAAEHDPQVARFFEELDLESQLQVEENATLDTETANRVARSMSNLRRSNAYWLDIRKPERLFDGGGQQLDALVHAAGQIAAVEAKQVTCHLAPAETPGDYVLTLDKSLRNVSLLNFTVADLGLCPAGKWGSEPLNGVEVVWSKAMLDAYHAARPTRATSSLGTTPADMVTPMHLQCATENALLQFRCNLEGERLKISCTSQRSRDVEPCIVEVTHPVSGINSNQRLTFRYGCCVERDAFNSELLGEFPVPLPHQVEFGKVDFNVRPPKESELWKFGSSHLSMLLAASAPLTAMPLTRESEDRYRFQVRDEDHAALRDENKTWMLRVAPQQNGEGE